MHNLAFGNDNIALEQINMAQTIIIMALACHNLALRQKRHANSNRHASFCVQLLYFNRVRCLELE